jgi:hypothetical protein
MFKSFFISTVAAAVSLSTLVSVATAGSADPMVGTWVNTNRNTRGITRLTISQSAGRYDIHVFGQCSPTDCDWGTSNLLTYGDNVSDSTHNYATASFSPSFATTVLSLQHSGNVINANSFTNFTDNSGRQNYHARENFRRSVSGPSSVQPIIKQQRVPQLPIPVQTTK